MKWQSFIQMKSLVDLANNSALHIEIVILSFD